MEQARLRWNCRRGMLELDLLLLPFFEKKFASLSTTEQALFAELLKCEDQDLHSWLVGQHVPTDMRFISLINQIRDYARSQKSGL